MFENFHKIYILIKIDKNDFLLKNLTYLLIVALEVIIINIQEEIGANIRRYRISNSYSIEELAFISELNPVHLSAIERGEKNVTLRTLEKLVNSLQIEFEDLFHMKTEIETFEDPLTKKIDSYLCKMNISEKEFILDTVKFVSHQSQKKKK